MIVRLIDEISDHRLVDFNYKAVNSSRVNFKKVIDDYSKAEINDIEVSLSKFF